jgi:dihydroorotate dehydrogenase
MLDLFSLARPLLHALPPETAHDVGLRALRYGLLPPQKFQSNKMLSQNILGMEFKNPVGIAAGFDKNAEVINPLLMQGFGFVEAGTVTPLPQSGNPKPRIFRLPEDKAVINRLGFNNNGLDYFVQNFSKRDKMLGIAGANIGKNKDTENAAEDYVRGLKAVYPHADYITINISSPNTKGLRDLQHREALAELLFELSKARNSATQTHGKKIPLFLKIAPDIDHKECEDIAETILKHAIDGLIVSNTTISRPQSLINQNCNETGGLSGAPLFSLSTKILAEMYKLTYRKIPIIGVGGISSAEDAYIKIRSGASLVQLYSALIYQGFGLVRSINEKLPTLLSRDGFSHISEAVGTSVI